jgi:hypothetical protein
MEGRTEGMDTFTPRVQSSPLGATFTPGDHLSPLGAKLNPTWGLRVEPTKCPLPTLKTARNSKNKESSFNGALGCTFWTNRPPKGSFYDNRWFFVEASFFSLFPIQWMKISGGERNGWNPFKKNVYEMFYKQASTKNDLKWWNWNCDENWSLSNDFWISNCCCETAGFTWVLWNVSVERISLYDCIYHTGHSLNTRHKRNSFINRENESSTYWNISNV